MAAPFTSEVIFEECLPLIDIVVRELTLTTGMMIDCQSAGVDDVLWRISNQKAAMAIDLMPYVEVIPYKYTYLIASDPFNKWNPYLHRTLLFVLLKLGGKSEDQLPVWAGLPWLVAQKDWNPNYLKGFELWYKR
ncbi:hypothetical protein [Hymenobacter guriensis]|uniref:Uncharacterized protein n=1 Tax=Hymenobacter guriensis TaxID=2793065 RepID=A0ABS0L3A5_9BACT|nr:hypothetical protein [Hymenobacter guriensis]MBG8554600.1 hypothetical protein [Hymenobacter guriensis]